MKVGCARVENGSFMCFFFTDTTEKIFFETSLQIGLHGLAKVFVWVAIHVTSKASLMVY